MKKAFILLSLIFSISFSNAQAPSVVKALAGTITEPNSKDQEEWKNNEWNGKFFYRGTGSGIKLCITDGTNAGTVFVADLLGSTYKATIPAQDFMYIITNVASFSPSFTSTDYIYKSDGTTAGTTLVFTMPGITSFSNSNTWTSDRDAKKNFSVTGNTMFFGGYDPINGSELWVTDGTSAGTHIVKDLRPGIGDGLPQAFCKIGGEIFFTGIGAASGRKLWKTDGTAAGTVQIPVSEPFFILDNTVGVVNNKMIFYAHNTVDGFEPYVSDGTAAGTFMLANINPSGNSWLSQSQNAHMRFNSKFVFFIANNGTANALWRTDGTAAGTIQLTTNTQAAFSGVSGGSYTETDENGLWMIEYNSVGSGSNEKLYRSDGTVSGTYLAASGLSYAQYLKSYKGGLWMASRNIASAANVEPWRCGGNAAATNKAFEIEPGNSGSPTFTPLSSNPYGFFVKNNKLYFFASTSIPSGHNLYQYHGNFTFNGSQAGGRWRDSANWNGMMPPGIVDSVFVNSGTPNAMNVDGTTAYAGILTLGNNANLNLTNATDSLVVNTKLISGTNAVFTGNGVMVFKSITNDTVQITNGFTANNAAVQSNASLINGNASISNNINLSNGKLFLNNNNLILTGNSSTATATGNAYIATNGTGSLQIQNIGTGARTGVVNFPVGTAANYSPVTITNSGTSDVFTARAINNLYADYTGETPGAQQYVGNAVGNTWFINEGTTGGSNVILNLQWNASLELPGFDRSQTILAHYTGGAWNLGTAGAAAGTGPFNYSRTNITSFSPFGIRNAGVVVPLKFLSFSAQKCNNNQICLNWKTANEQNVSHFEAERSSDGRIFTSIKIIPAQNLPANYYSCVDDISGISAGKIFYRIKQLDHDGKSTYSTVQAVSLSKTITFALYPNPAVSSVNILGWENVQQAVVIDAAGKKLLDEAVTNPVLDVSKLPAGVYTVKLLLKNKGTQIEKFIK